MIDPSAEFQVKLFAYSQYFSQSTLLETLLPQTVPGSERVAAEEIARAALRDVQHAREQFSGGSTCTQLDQAFSQLWAEGVACFDWCDSTISSGHGLATELAREAGKAGYCFFHAQDLAHCIESDELWLAYDATDSGGAVQPLEVGQRVLECLRSCGLDASWTGSISDRIRIKALRWLRSYSEVKESEVLSRLRRSGEIAA